MQARSQIGTMQDMAAKQYMYDRTRGNLLGVDLFGILFICIVMHFAFESATRPDQETKPTRNDANR